MHLNSSYITRHQHVVILRELPHLPFQGICHPNLSRPTYVHTHDVYPMFQHVTWSWPSVNRGCFCILTTYFGSISVMFAGLEELDSVYASPSDFEHLNHKETCKGLALLEKFVKLCNEAEVTLTDLVSPSRFFLSILKNQDSSI